MGNVDKFSLAARKGINQIHQASMVSENHDGTLRAHLSYFTFTLNEKSGAVAIDSFGSRTIREDELPAYLRAAATNPACRNMLDQARNAFSLIRSQHMPPDEANEVLNKRTEDFFDTYIQSERIGKTSEIPTDHVRKIWGLD